MLSELLQFVKWADRFEGETFARSSLFDHEPGC